MGESEVLAAGGGDELADLMTRRLTGENTISWHDPTPRTKQPIPLGWVLGYPFAVALMAIVCLSLYVIFKRRDWL
ncbi:hypothetical protein [Streptomyces sp. NPDC058613]|uniref:hypothetical protein n=1 Tax=unclassified Streptomyces TaxID=2593676 RepID=UPI0036615E2E